MAPSNCALAVTLDQENKVAQHKIFHRKWVLVNTDPKRRCYNGAHFSCEWQWTAWSVLEHADETQVEERMKFWRGLNDFAVSQRGPGAKCEYKSMVVE
jgi:hypothetical protein